MKNQLKKSAMELNNALEIGSGIYTAKDIARILRLPYYKVYRWINKYWDGDLGQQYAQAYSWQVDGTKAVSFHTLVEFYILLQLADAGVITRKVLMAHRELSQMVNSPSPFAMQSVLDNMYTDGRDIFFEVDSKHVSLNGSRQLNLEFIKLFLKKLDFDDSLMALRLWPLGREKSILVDPARKFGHPVVGSLNIYPETLYNLFQAGEDIAYIAMLYEIEEELVKDAIEFCKAA